MGLPGQLSALRELILGDHELPNNLGERVCYLRNVFPRLDPLAVEDLAKMEPQRLHTYTTSIFSGERGLLESVFPLSLALVTRAWSMVYGEVLDSFVMVRAIHRYAPWKSIASVALFRNFVTAVPSLWPEVVSEEPALPDTLKMELFTTEVRRCDCPNVRHLGGMPASGLASLQVEQFLDMSVFRPPATRVLRSEFDIFEAHRFFWGRDRTLPDRIVSQSTRAICARSPENYCSWLALTSAECELLERLTEGVSLTVEEVAERLVRESQERNPQAALSEEQLFALFFARMVEFIEAGVLVVGIHGPLYARRQ